MLDAVFSAIAIIPAIGSAIAAPMKAIFHAVGNATEISKAVASMGIIFGGANKIVSKLDDISKGVKTIAKTISDAIGKLKKNRTAQFFVGKNKLNTIATGIQKGISSLLSRASQVISTVKTAVKKSIKEDAVKAASRRISYAKVFSKQLLNFNKGYRIGSKIDKDLFLVQYHCADGSLKYWTTIEQANQYSTMSEVMDGLALLPEWGERNLVSVAKIPARTKVKYAVGTAKRQISPKTGKSVSGGGVQYLFSEFDPS